MHVRLFKFPVTNLEEIYAVVDKENTRLHISSVHYSYSLTLDLTKDLKEEIKEWTKWGEQSFNAEVRKALYQIIKELKLA